MSGNVKTNSWEQEGGVYKISVGSSSEDIILSDEISLKGTTDKKRRDCLYRNFRKE